MGEIRRTRVLLVGQAPSRVMQPGDPPFWGTQALARLAKYCGESDPPKLYEVYDFINLVDEYPGPSAPGSKWDQKPKIPSDRREWLFKQVMERTTVILLGAAARDVFLAKGSKMFGWRRLSDDPVVQVTWSAHPGGTSMWWNRPENTQAGKDFWSFSYEAARRIEGAYGLLQPMAHGSGFRRS